MTEVSLFPSIEDVFENPEEVYKAIFFPLLTIDLNSIHKGNGKLHFLAIYGSGGNPNRFEDCNFGHSHIRFRVKENKYLYEGDIKHIQTYYDKVLGWYQQAKSIYNTYGEEYYDSPMFQEKQKLVNTGDLIAIEDDGFRYVDALINFWMIKADFLTTGKLFQRNQIPFKKQKRKQTSFNILGKLFQRKQKKVTDIKREVKPYNHFGTEFQEDGLQYLKECMSRLNFDFNSFKFIGTIGGHSYTRFGEDAMSLFYNEKDSEVFQFFTWT